MTTDTALAELIIEKKESELGLRFAKNVANFVQMIIAVRSSGTNYNPSAELLKLLGLERLRNKANNALVALQKADSAYRDSVNDRQIVFENMNLLATRIKKTVKSLCVNSKLKDEISALSKKITAKNIFQKKEESEKSISRMNVDSRTYNFRQLVIKLADIPEYKPKEIDLSIQSLNKYIDILALLTVELQINLKNLVKTRREHDEIMFKEDTGLVSVAYMVKEYVKSVFGSSSLLYKKISGLKFKTQ